MYHNSKKTLVEKDAIFGNHFTMLSAGCYRNAIIWSLAISVVVYPIRKIDEFQS